MADSAMSDDISMDEVQQDTRPELWVKALQHMTSDEPLIEPELERKFFAEIFGSDIQDESYISGDLDMNGERWMETINHARKGFFTRYDRVRSSSPGLTHWQLLMIIKTLFSDTKSGSTARVSDFTEVLAGHESLLKLDQQEAKDFWWCVIYTTFMVTPSPSFYNDGLQGLWGDTSGLDIFPHFRSLELESRNSRTAAVRFPRTFRTEQLEIIAGIKIVWTHNLADHLTLIENDTGLLMFCDASILSLHQFSDSSPLPDGLARETIASIALLVPSIDGKPSSWFQIEYCRETLLDPGLGECDKLRPIWADRHKFNYWLPRMERLKQVFDEAESKNLYQLWHDDRNKTQWLTFSIAVLVFIMTIFFGTIQSITGIVQAWASVAALRRM